MEPKVKVIIGVACSAAGCIVLIFVVWLFWGKNGNQIRGAKCSKSPEGSLGNNADGTKASSPKVQTGAEGSLDNNADDGTKAPESPPEVGKVENLPSFVNLNMKKMTAWNDRSSHFANEEERLLAVQTARENHYEFVKELTENASDDPVFNPSTNTIDNDILLTINEIDAMTPQVLEKVTEFTKNFCTVTENCKFYEKRFRVGLQKYFYGHYANMNLLNIFTTLKPLLEADTWNAWREANFEIGFEFYDVLAELKGNDLKLALDYAKDLNFFTISYHELCREPVNEDNFMEDVDYEVQDGYLMRRGFDYKRALNSTFDFFTMVVCNLDEADKLEFLKCATISNAKRTMALSNKVAKDFIDRFDLETFKDKARILLNTKDIPARMEVIFILQAAIEFWKAELSKQYDPRIVEAFQKLEPLSYIKICQGEDVLKHLTYWELFHFQLKLTALTEPKKAEAITNDFHNPILAFINATKLTTGVENDLQRLKFSSVEDAQQKSTDEHFLKKLQVYPTAKDFVAHSDDLNYLKQPELMKKMPDLESEDVTKPMDVATVCF